VQMQPEWGRPDGGATDEEGCYWSCGVGAGRINRFSADGELIGFVEMPIQHPTMPCFGGPYGRTMHVTSHRENYSAEEHLNIGSGEEITTAALAGLIADVVGYRGKLTFDASRPDGTPRKLLDVSRLKNLGWVPRIALREGVRQTYDWYCRERAA